MGEVKIDFKELICHPSLTHLPEILEILIEYILKGTQWMSGWHVHLAASKKRSHYGNEFCSTFFRRLRECVGESTGTLRRKKNKGRWGRWGHLIIGSWKLQFTIYWKGTGWLSDWRCHFRRRSVVMSHGLTDGVCMLLHKDHNRDVSIGISSDKH